MPGTRQRITNARRLLSGELIVTDLLHSPVFLSITAGVLIVLGTTFARCWVKVRRTTIEAELKIEMIRQGMSADEICQVIQSRAGDRREYARSCD
jgi:hypothetical protein